MRGTPHFKYLVTSEASRTLHIVAYKGGDVVHTLCGASYSKWRSRTVTRADRSHVVCSECDKCLRV